MNHLLNELLFLFHGGREKKRKEDHTLLTIKEINCKYFMPFCEGEPLTVLLLIRGQPQFSYILNKLCLFKDRFSEILTNVLSSVEIKFLLPISVKFCLARQLVPL